MSQPVPGIRKAKKQATSKAQKAQEQEVTRQRAIVKDVLYPFLLKHSKNITDAKRLCHILQTSFTQEYQKKVALIQQELSSAPTSEFKIENITKLEKKDFATLQALAGLFKNEKLSVSNALIGGMVQAIDSFVNEEVSSRDLSSLKTTFL